jgi:hypothetical protein
MIVLLQIYNLPQEFEKAELERKDEDDHYEF